MAGVATRMGHEHDRSFAMFAEELGVEDLWQNHLNKQQGESQPIDCFK
jgi:hypothetical protein